MTWERGAVCLRHTILDIARHSGISKSTVSRVISGKGSTSAEAREKVLKAIEELQFKPNALARAMVLQRTNTIGVIIHGQHYPIASHPFYGKILDAILSAADKLKYSVFVSTDNDMTQQSANFMLENRVDGVIAISRVSDETVQSIHKFDIPYLLINRHVEEDVVQIYNDDEMGGQLAADHLIDLGHRNIAVIAGPQTKKHSHAVRADSFIKKARKRGLQHSDLVIVHSNSSNFDDGFRLLNNLWERSHNKPTAVFATSDMLALGAIRALIQKGLQIPTDISVLGFDNIDYANYSTPSLSTIDVDKWNMGFNAVVVLDQLIQRNPIQNGSLCYVPQLIQRASTGLASLNT